MPTNRAERWIANNSGFLLRRNRTTRGVPPSVTLLENSLSTATVQNPVSLSDLQTYFGLSSLTDNSTMRNRMQVVNVGGAYGKVMRVTLPNTDDGVVWQPKLTQPFVEGYIEYDFRFVSGFGWGGGGKMPGLSGIAPAAPDGRTVPPSGNVPSRYGWGGRHMWIKDSFGGDVTNGIEWIGYRYWPTQVFPNSYGDNIHTNVSLGTQGGTSDGVWRHCRSYYRMNDTDVVNLSTSPTSLVEGTHYRANGLWKITIDGATIPQYESNSLVWRLYESAKITHMQFSVFYGGDTTWADGGGAIDIANLRIVKVA